MPRPPGRCHLGVPLTGVRRTSSARKEPFHEHVQESERAKGRDQHPLEGRYREVTPKERSVQTFDWDGMPGYPSVTTITFEDLGDGRTRVVSSAIFFTTEERDGMLEAGMEQGMNQSYAALDELLAR